MSKTSITQKFQAKVEYRSDGCWNWIGHKMKSGYGQMRVGGNKHHLAHRLSWELSVGPIPEGMCVCHKCDHPSCVNPSHLFLGTLQENNLDRDRKGRNTKGEQQPAHKLTDDLVWMIRRAVKNGVTQASIARKLGVPSATVNKAVTGKTWRHV